MKLLVCFIALGAIVGVFSALEHDWTHLAFAVAGCAAGLYIRFRLRRSARQEDPADA